MKIVLRKDIFACFFSIHNTISLSCHEQVCLSGLNILVHDMINLLYLSLLLETEIFDRCIITFLCKWLKIAL